MNTKYENIDNKFADCITFFVPTGGGGGSSAYARSHGTGTTTVPNSSDTKMTLNSNDFASGITWDATNHQFTIVMAGKYLITALTTFTNTTSGKGYQTEVFKNGSEIMASNMMASANGGAVSPVTTDIQSLAANDVIALYAFQNSGGNQTVGSGTDQTYLALTQIDGGGGGGISTDYEFIFTPPFPYEVLSVVEKHSVAGTDSGSVTLDVLNVPDETAASAGTSILAAKFNLKNTANAAQIKGGLDLVTNRTFSPKDSIAVKVAGVTTSLAGVQVTVYYKPLNFGEFRNYSDA